MSILNIFLVIDRDISGIPLVAGGVKAGRGNIWIDASSFSEGNHDVVLYAVNDLGFVSNPTHLAILVVPLPKPSNPGSRGLGTRAIAGIAIG
jgi:hypothetical protein